jgi:DNA-binding NarL/FixJ family response regulator
VAITLILADDHPVVLEGLAQLFGLEPDFRVVARCTNGDDAVAAVRHHQPDVLVLDVRMPGKDGLVIVRELRDAALSTRVVLLTAALSETGLVEAVRLGVWGIVFKEMAPQVLVNCVREVHAGERWLGNRSVVRALERVVQREASVQQFATQVTPRELEIIRMIATGLRNKEIAAQLGITEGTVKIHLHNIYEKLEVDGRLALVLHAQRHGVV